MSTMIMSACWPLQGMTPVQKSVLISLADNANDEGYCWPSIATIVKRTCASQRGVQNAIQWLESVGLVSANRTNGRHTTYTVTPSKYKTPAASAGVSDSRTPAVSAPPQPVHPRTECTPALSASTPAASAPHPRTECVGPPQSVPSNRKEPSREPSLNRQGARRAPRVALHAELLNLELPASIPFAIWDMWCEHREAKAKDAPWTRPAARISIKRLEKLAAKGQSPEVTVEEAVLRGWTGLFPVRAHSAAPGATGGAAPENWWKTESGITQRAAQLGVTRKPNQLLEQFKAKVLKAAGPGEWMEDMLRTVSRESETRYEALYAYFNDIPKEQPMAEAA